MAILGLRQLLTNLNEITATQIPFAAARMLTATAKDVAAAETAHINTAFDRPTPFTQRSIGFSPANKRDLSATVFVKDVQAGYLSAEVFGGARGFKSFEEKFGSAGGAGFAMPAKGVRLNQYGNVSKAAIMKIVGRASGSESFIGTPKGSHRMAGVYARVGKTKRLQALMVFTGAASYKPRFQFHEVGQKTFEATYRQNFAAAWDGAVRSMKR